MTFFAPKKTFYEIDPSGLRSAGMALSLFTAVISLLPAENDKNYIQEIETIDGDEGDSSTPSPPPNNTPSTNIWGGTRLGQWVVIERIISLLMARNQVDRNTKLVVDHGDFSFDLYISDLPNGRLSGNLRALSVKIATDIMNRRGGYILGRPKVFPLHERPLSRDPYPVTMRKLVAEKLRGEHVPVPFSEEELKRILYADVSKPGVLKSLAAIRPHLCGRFLLEWRKFGLSTASVRVLESDDYDVEVECDWFERVFPELIPPGIDVIARPVTSLPQTGFFTPSA